MPLNGRIRQADGGKIGGIFEKGPEIPFTGARES